MITMFIASASMTILIFVCYGVAIFMSFTRNVAFSAMITAISSLLIVVFFPHALFIMLPAVLLNMAGIFSRLVLRKSIKPLFVKRDNLTPDRFTYGDYRQYLIKHDDGEFTPCRIVFPFPKLCLVEEVGKKSVNQMRQDF